MYRTLTTILVISFFIISCGLLKKKDDDGGTKTVCPKPTVLSSDPINARPKTELASNDDAMKPGGAVYNPNPDTPWYSNSPFLPASPLPNACDGIVPSNVVTGVPNPYYPYPSPTVDPGCDSKTMLSDDAGASADVAVSPYIPNPVCESSKTQPKNIPVEGKNETIGLQWKVLAGLMNFADAAKQCAAMQGYRLATIEEINKLITVSDFISPVEKDCSTSFWAGQASSVGAQCTASAVKLAYVSSNASYLPINKQYALQSQVEQGVVSELRSALCVAGALTPTVPCSQAVDTLFAQNPMGIMEVTTGQTWARMTIKSFQNADEAARQCAEGASEGWRIPTKDELERAVKGDVFKTQGYAARENDCKTAWYKPADAQTVVCGRLAADKDGKVTFLNGVNCNVNSSLVKPDASVAIDPMPTAVPQPYYNVLGLCIKDKK